MKNIDLNATTDFVTGAASNSQTAACTARGIRPSFKPSQTKTLVSVDFKKEKVNKKKEAQKNTLLSLLITYLPQQQLRSSLEQLHQSVHLHFRFLQQKMMNYFHRTLPPLSC